jgi:hypothetical protein
MVIIIFIITSIFLAKELLKKFRFMKSFFQSCPYTTSRHYDGKRNPGMYTIVLKSNQEFSVLIGFHIHIKLLWHHGYDPFGYVASTDKKAVISLFLGKEPLDIQFFTSVDPKDITISSTQKDQHIPVDVTYPPHRRQRLWFFW